MNIAVSFLRSTQGKMKRETVSAVLNLSRWI